jgi:hypothetical protein
MDFREDREILDKVQERNDESYYEDYHRTVNAVSIDGMPAHPDAPDPVRV